MECYFRSSHNIWCSSMTIKSNTFIHAKECKWSDGGGCVFAYECFQGRWVILKTFYNHESLWEFSGRYGLIYRRVDICMCAHAQLCPTLWDPRDCSLPGSSVYRIFQARILEWVATSYFRGSSQPRVKPVSPTLQVDSSPLCHLGSRYIDKYIKFFMILPVHSWSLRLLEVMDHVGKLS